jgi:hypothetical protein
MAPIIVSEKCSSGGFASTTVIAICLGLSLVAVALAERSLGQYALVKLEHEREVQRQALRSAINLAVADLANDPESALGVHEVRVGSHAIVVEATNEQARIDIVNAPDDRLIELLATATGLEGRPADAVLAARAAPGAVSHSVKQVLDTADVPPEHRTCLEQRLTAYRSSVDPFSANLSGIASKSGGIVRLSARVAGERIIDWTLQRTVVLTGQLDEPVLTVHEAAYRTSELEACANDES